MTGPAPILGRRRFVQAAACALPIASVQTAGHASVLRGPTVALEIAAVSIVVAGRTKTAIGINGMSPAPTLHWREGDTVTIAVTNRLAEPTSLHWHGLRVEAAMDGVPGFGFRAIAPGETFVYRLTLRQAGTYWYHSHSGFQEQAGLYGAIVIDPRDGYAEPFDRDYVVLLSGWSDTRAETMIGNLKAQSDYYNTGRRTVGTFLRDLGETGPAATLADRRAWGEMRMTPTDILDAGGSAFTYTINGHSADAGWTALYRAGERVRLRFINASSMTLFDVRVPGLPMLVVQADGNDVEPVEVDECRLGVGETYDAIVRPDGDRAFAVFAQAMDRGGFALGTLAPRKGVTASAPPMDRPPLRSMTDMGMNHSMPGGAPMDHGGAHATSTTNMHDGHGSAAAPPTASRSATGAIGVTVDNVVANPIDRLGEPGTGLENNGRRVLTYAQLRATRPGDDPRPPSRDIQLRLTGNMARFIWGFDGKTHAEAEPIPLRLGERVRFVLINDTMMEHPIHLHGFWSELENGQGAYQPYKHTITVKPAERLSFLVTADEPGRWAFHCHMLLHMETGMFREVRVS